MQSRKRIHVALVMALVVGAAIPASGTASGQGRPTDRLLTGTERAAVMAGMTREERTILGSIFKDKDALIVGYARNVVELELQPDGSVRPRVTGDDATVLRFDALTPPPHIDSAASNLATREAARTARTAASASVGTTTPGTSLYQSLTVTRQCGTCLQWNIHHFYNWQGTTGLGPNNGNKDRIGTSWGSSFLALKSGSFFFNGHYTSGSNFSPTDQYVNANAGVGWGFREWQHPSLGYYSDWGYGNSSVVETSYHNLSTNFVGGYAHTGLGNTGGSITFGFAKINFNGADDFEWQFGLNVLT